VSRDDAAIERLQRALDDLADAEAPSIVTEALIEARARVRSMLAEAMAERMLERAESQLGSDRRHEAPAPSSSAGDPLRHGKQEPRADLRESARTPPSTSAPRDFGRYVYGIVDESFEVPPLDGVEDGQAVELVREGGLGALVSRVSLDVFGEETLRERLEDLAWLERHARRHEQVLESARLSSAAIVPMRLFTIYANDASVRDMLAREHDFFAGALAYLAGRSEWGVKLFAVGQPADQGAGAEHGPASGPGERYMLDRRAADLRAEAVGRRLEQRREDAHRRLAELAVEARTNPLQPPELAEHEGTMLMNGVYLVDDDAADEFRLVVSTLRGEWAREDVEIVLTGPWPPYNFVHAAREAPV
jgi:hypothetical protein